MSDMLANYTVFLFDFDGTLTEPLTVNWSHVKAQADEIALSHGLDINSSSPLTDKLAKAFAFSHDLKKEILDLYYRVEKDIINVTQNKNVFPLFERCTKDEEKNVYIVSNNTTYIIQKTLTSWNVQFDASRIFALDTMDFPKPQVSFYEKIAGDLKFIEKAVFIGNSWVDKETAQLLHITYVDVNTLK